MRNVIIILAITVLVCTIALYLQLMRQDAPAEGSGSPAIGGAFALTDHTGKPVTDRDFRGKYTLVFFGFTNCPDVCPTTLMSITDLMDEADPQGARITPLFVSVDTGDTPDTMRDYLSAFHPSVVGLTGDAEQIKRVAAAYKVYYARVDQPDTTAGYTMDHSSFLFFMDPEGRYITHFRYQDPVGEMAARITQEMEKRK